MLSFNFSNDRGYIVENGSSIITSALHQALVGLLSNFQIGRQAQSELDKLVDANKFSTEDTQDLVVLPAIIAESLRLGVLSSPMDFTYKTKEDLWYKRWFIPKNSIIIFDRDDIFTTKLSDSQVTSWNANLIIVST